MNIEIQSDLRTDGPSFGRPWAVPSRLRRRACLPGAEPDQLPAANDDNVVATMEKLADILACIFAEAQETGTMNLPGASERQLPQQSQKEAA